MIVTRPIYVAILAVSAPGREAMIAARNGTGATGRIDFFTTKPSEKIVPAATAHP